MGIYHCAIIAVDLTDESHQVLHHSLQMVGHDPNKLHLVHACEHPITGYGELTGKNHLITETQIRQAVYPSLEKFSRKYKLLPSNIHINFGQPAAVIHSLAIQLQADLIVVGSHGKHGIQLLLGSTANSVIHGAACDVLTIRIKPEPNG